MPVGWWMLLQVTWWPLPDPSATGDSPSRAAPATSWCSSCMQRTSPTTTTSSSHSSNRQPATMWCTGRLWSSCPPSISPASGTSVCRDAACGPPVRGDILLRGFSAGKQLLVHRWRNSSTGTAYFIGVNRHHLSTFKLNAMPLLSCSIWHHYDKSIDKSYCSFLSVLNNFKNQLKTSLGTGQPHDIHQILVKITNSYIITHHKVGVIVINNPYRIIFLTTCKSFTSTT
mmetsp:Transcript_33986/g.49359  ORF Transcript_33986/g.49359 Transcript_33986/m.49359 type:complete len:228 (-) Transcript_33986:540-1223(-)